MHIADLTKSYHRNLVLDDVSFDVPQARVTSFIGPNGAGKSTMLRILARLVAQDSGEVEFQGKRISDWKRPDLAKHVAILNQTNETQMKLTVRDLVAFGRFPYSGNTIKDTDKGIIDQAISFMELEEYENRYLDELSGGQRQRAYIAMVLAQDTEYILLDEPTNSLDIYHASNLMKMIRRLCDELGKTIVMVLHDINYAAFYSDYICAFAERKIAKFGTVEEVITKEVLSSIYKVDFEILKVNGKPLSVYY